MSVGMLVGAGMFGMRQELRKVMKELDAAAARLNAGLGAVAVVLSVTLAATLTVKLYEFALFIDAQQTLPLGP
jgi:hypothetical protein